MGHIINLVIISLYEPIKVKEGFYKVIKLNDFIKSIYEFIKCKIIKWANIKCTSKLKGCI